MDPTYRGLSVPTPTKQPQKSNFLPLLAIGGGIIILLIVVIVMMSMMSGNSGNKPQRLVMRLDNLSTTMNTAKSNISSDALSKINTDASIVITGDIAAISKLITVKSDDKALASIKTEEADTATVEKLKTALLNGQHDSTYKETLMTKFQSVHSLAGEISKSSSNQSLKAALATLQSHLDTYYNQLKALP